MIIETLTAFTSIKIVFETLEIFHMVHVGHITGKASYKGGSIIKGAIQQQQLKWQDKKIQLNNSSEERKHSTVLRLLAMRLKQLVILTMRRGIILVG